MDGWTVFFLVVDAAAVVVFAVLAVRAGWADGGLRRRMWVAEAVAYAALFALVWLANPAMTFGAVAWFIPDAGIAGFGVWFAVGLSGSRGSREANWRVGAYALAAVCWVSLIIPVLLAHQSRQHGVTDQDRDTALLGQKLDNAHNHVPTQVLVHRPTLADANLAGASAERIERSVFGPGKLTMVVHAAASCEPAAVLLFPQGATVEALVVFQRSIFLSPLPSPSAAAAGGLCLPPAPGNFMDSGYQSVEVAVQVDLPAGLTATTVEDASQP